MSTKQLYEKTSEGMKEVSPLVSIEDIYSKLSDTPLEALVALFNHVKCEWKGTVADTRRTVPLFLRRSGLFITYNNGTKYITEFFSTGADQITTEGWVKDSNWTSVPDEDYISAGVKPGVGTIGYEQLNDNLKQLFREKVNVTNFPDDEDIASVDNMLKLKDREADAANFQSKGYVILRKNLRLVNGVVKNILTQDMINQPNVIYEIRYDFDLNGETLKVPENCTLRFEGGNIGNGNIIGNNTSISAALTRIFSIDASKYYISGTFRIFEWNAVWFGAISDCRVINNTFTGTDNFSAIQSAINASYLTNIKNIHITTGNYRLSKPLLVGYSGYHSFNLYGDFTNNIDDVEIGTKLYFDTTIGGLFISGLRRSSIKNIRIVGPSTNNIILGKSINKSDFFSGNIKNNGVINQGIGVGSIFNNKEFSSWYIPPFSVKFDGYSSDIKFTNINISGFYVGLGVQLINAIGGEDFHKLERLNISDCCYGYVSQGNQSRNQLIDSCNINSCWCAYTNCLLDNITGNTGGIIQNCNFDGCFKIFEFKGGNGNLYFNSCYAESTYTLGTILNSENASSISFNNCIFKLLQYKSISILPIINGNIGNQESRYLYYKNTNILVNSDDDLSKFMIPASSVIDNFLSDKQGKLLYGNIIIDNYINSNFTPFFKEITIPEGDELIFSISLSTTYLNLISINDYLVGYYYNASTYTMNEILLTVLSIEGTTVTFKFVCNYKNNKRIDTSSQKINLFKAFEPNKNKLIRFTKSYYGYTNPTIPITGDTFYNTKLNKFLFYNGSSWKTLLDQDSIQSGITAKRPTEVQQGFFYFDTTLNKPIWWTGTKWVDATGADV